VLHPLWTRLFLNAEIVMLADYRMLPDFGKVDAAIWTLEQAAALARSPIETPIGLSGGGKIQASSIS
jgi:hypothetical protein